MLIQEKKKQLAKRDIAIRCGCEKGCRKCAARRQFVDKMADSNIPVGYWDLSYSSFKGAINVKRAVQTYGKDLEFNYKKGNCLAFAGTMGTGKTMSACALLKHIIAAGYGAYYTTMSDMMTYLTDSQYKREFNKIVNSIDFLCIDEVDSRHYASSELSENFMGRTFEKVIRHRVQNRLPIILATNEVNLEDAFAGQFKKVVESLAAVNTTVVPALGRDYRLQNER